MAEDSRMAWEGQRESVRVTYAKSEAGELNGVGKPIIEGENPVSEAEDIRLYPEYHRTRETRWEDGGTTLQA